MDRGANVLLGTSQGLAWSMTVNMKIDLVGPGRRGFAMGLNEAAGYGALGLTALATGYVAVRYGLRPEPFYFGIVYSALGLVLSVFLVRDTRVHAKLEARPTLQPRQPRGLRRHTSSPKPAGETRRSFPHRKPDSSTT
jgi:predicted MFS family arabinose efflux permease